MSKNTYQIRIFICLDDLTKAGMSGWNEIEHKIELRGDVTPENANDLANKILKVIKGEK